MNERGLRQAPEMGRRLAGRNVKPDVILSSPALRALDDRATRRQGDRLRNAGHRR
ncbi:hypothetical protein ACTMU2_21025 [Cupriavidus basilensis]